MPEALALGIRRRDMLIGRSMGGEPIRHVFAIAGAEASAGRGILGVGGRSECPLGRVKASGDASCRETMQHKQWERFSAALQTAVVRDRASGVQPVDDLQ